MPEGPEIRRAADQLANALVGRVADEVWFAFDHLKPYESTLSGARVTAVTSRGKAILTHFDNDYTIYSHNQLYGKWRVRKPYHLLDTNWQLRLAIHNKKKSALLYSASDIEVWPDAELDDHPFLRRLGPDLLDEATTLERVGARFVDKKFWRRRLSSLLLDQGFLAGLGNYLRSEVLFVARVHPSLRPIDCTPGQIDALAEATLLLTRQSYKTKGVTNDLQLAEALKADGRPFRAYRFWVFNRDGRPCRVCRTPIVREEINGRRLYFCPSCQSLRQ